MTKAGTLSARARSMRQPFSACNRTGSGAPETFVIVLPRLGFLARALRLGELAEGDAAGRKGAAPRQMSQAPHFSQPVDSPKCAQIRLCRHSREATNAVMSR